MNAADIVVWQGFTADIAGAIEQLGITDSCEARDEAIPLASRADYAEAMRTAGLMGKKDELAKHSQLAAAAQAHWHATGSDGCTFAAFLSERRDEYGWETHVVSGSSDARDLAYAIAEVVERRQAEPEVEVVSVLLPELDDEALLSALLVRLAGLTDWDVHLQGRETNEDLGPLVRLGVRAAVEFDHWSEVLGFGCFAAQANTRLAPFTEMAIRAKPPKTHRLNQRAYMADIDTGFERDQVRAWWRATEDDRSRRLGKSQDLRGKARVTFSLLESVWDGAAE
jgi:hypothetical protein